MPFFTREVLSIDGVLTSAEFCNVFNNQILCAFAAKQKLFATDSLRTLWCSRCVTQCTHTDFQVTLSAQSAPSEGDRENWRETLLGGQYNTSVLLPSDFSQRFDYYFNRNYLKVQISCGSKYVTEYKQEAKLTIIDTFAAIGGQTGL
jgi:hypothetical protein